MAIDNIDEAIRSILVNDATVKAITTRCYPLTIPPRPAYPLMLYMDVSGSVDNHLRSDSGMAHRRYQIEAWAESYAEVKTLATAMRSALNQYSGTVGTVVVGSIIVENEHETYESEIKVYRAIKDYMIWYNI